MQPLKAQLKDGLIDKINKAYEGLPINNMPNCVMFVEKNQNIAKELAKWVNNVTDTDYILIKDENNNEKMLDDLYNELENSEKNYQNTGKRTIMFVENMDKFLKPETSDDTTIADFKDLMQRVGEDYHTTILFSGENPDKYATGINELGRIDLEIK